MKLRLYICVIVMSSPSSSFSMDEENDYKTYSIFTPFFLRPFYGPKNIYDAILRKDADACKRFLNQKEVFKIPPWYIHICSYSPLHYASYKGYESICKILIDGGCDLYGRTSTGATPLHIASECGHERVCRLLIDADPDDQLNSLVNFQDCSDRTPLHYAVKYFKVEIIRLLIEKGVVINIKDKEHCTPLEFTVRGCSFSDNLHTIQIVSSRLLIEANADVNCKGNKDQSPLHTACFFRNKEACWLLLSKGATINAKDANGETALHVASSWRNNEEICRILIDSNADVNLADNSGNTPLHKASFEDCLKTCLLLLESKAVINAKNNEGEIPLKIAEKKGYKDICYVLLNL